MIRISNLTKEFNGQVVLKDINLVISDGELLVILGESGSGKSVLLQHLIGILKPDSGIVEINGIDITKMPEHQLLNLRRDIGYLFQEGALYDFMTVFENVEFPLKEHTKLKNADIVAKVEDVLEMLGIKEARNKYPSELSGGMKKRCALARSIILDSKILFCDEPTSGLDPIRSQDITDVIRDLTRQLRCTTVVTSHDIANSFRIADRIVLIHEGVIRAQGTPAQLKESKDEFIGRFLQSV